MENFNDLLEEMNRQGGPLMWITQKRLFTQFESSAKSRRTPEQIKLDVLASARIKHTIEQILAKSASPNSPSANLKREDVLTEARKILDEMAHQFDLKYVRLLGYILIKVFARIYKHIYVNSDAFANLSVVKSHPTILLPLHRSYMDFLLVSIVCFHLNVQLPGVAAGEDFLGLGFMAKAIRRTGAFFIRRSFGSDELYWSIFHEYVQQHLLNCDRPLEFFIEGTRSRTSKSLRPRQGMLATCAELFLRGHRASDIYFVPISLTYERLLEESLYANELLGIPKPKESVKGLFKARSILNECYGTIFVNFARPISLKEAFARIEMSSSIEPERSLVNLTPSFIFELTPRQTKSLESLSYYFLIEMLRNQILQPISIISTCLLLSMQSEKFDSERSMSITSLCYQLDKLKRILSNLGARIYWPADVSSSTNSSTPLSLDGDESAWLRPLVLTNIQLHPNLFELDTKQDRVRLKQPHLTNPELLFESASLYIALCSYRNQLANHLVRVSFVSVALLTSSTLINGATSLRFNLTAAFEIYKFLVVLFNREFIFRTEDDQTRKDFNDSLNCLLHLNLIKRSTTSSDVELEKLNIRQFLFFCKHVQPILENYKLIYDLLSEVESTSATTISFTNEKELIKRIQTSAFDLMQSSRRSEGIKPNGSFDFEVLSLNLINNSILALKQFSVLSSGREINRPGLISLYRKLRAILDVTRSRLSELVRISCSIERTNDHERDFCFRETENEEENKSDRGALFLSEYQESFPNTNTNTSLPKQISSKI